MCALVISAFVYFGTVT